jgi:hypothetical protein
MKKTLKSFRTLATDLKVRRKPSLTNMQIEKANKVFEKIEQEKSIDNSKRKIARQPEV